MKQNNYNCAAAKLHKANENKIFMRFMKWI